MCAAIRTAFFVNTLNKGEHFYVRSQREANGKCYYYGDALGSLNQHNVWVACGDLDQLENHPTPRPAVKPEFHQSGTRAPQSVVTTRDHLKERFGNLLPEERGHRNGAALVQPALIDRFDPDPSLNSIKIFGKRDPITGRLTDLQRVIDFNNTREQIKPRYTTKDGKAIVVDVMRPGQASGTGLWGFIERNRARLVMPPRRK